MVPEFQGPPEQRYTAGNNGRIRAVTGEDPSIKEPIVDIEASSRIQECPFGGLGGPALPFAVKFNFGPPVRFA